MTRNKGVCSAQLKLRPFKTTQKRVFRQRVKPCARGDRCPDTNGRKSLLFSVKLGFAEIEFPLQRAQDFIANAALITQLHGRLAFDLQQLAR